jgi:hypothetical protein
MGACEVCGIGLGVACQAFVSLCIRNVCGFEGKDVRSPSFFEVCLCIAMASRAAVIDCMGLGHERFGQVFVTISTGIDIRFLSDGLGSGKISCNDQR